MFRFYTHDKIMEGHSLTLSREESHHLTKVLRLKTGDKVLLIDGKGGLAHATVLEDVPKSTTVLIEKLTSDQASPRVSIAFGISKSNATETLIRRTTEIGVSSFQPLLTQHSLHPESWNEERWNKLITEVCKQCEQLIFPKLLPPLKFIDWLKKREEDTELIYSYENSRDDKLELTPLKKVDLVIGSEGGFSKEEISLLEEHHAKSLGLGKNKLRVETASLVALVLVKQMLGEI